MDFSSWANSVSGQAVDVQAGLGAQCYGLMQNFINNVLGVPGMIPGTYAIDVYNNPGSLPVTKLGPDATPQPGDIAFWNWGSRIAPESHVAIVNADAGNDLSVYSQNSPQKYTTLQNLPKEGIAGYLRPNQFDNGAPTSTIAPDATTASNSGVQGTNPAVDAISNWVLGLLSATDAAGTTGAGHFQNFMTNLFLPSTYIRVISGFIGVGLIILGIVFIVMDYRGNKETA